MVWSKPYDVVVAVAIAASDEEYTCGEGIADEDMLRANSLLIAAAPELYELLSAMAEYMSDIPESAAGGDDYAVSLCRKANAVLKKFRGEA